MLTIVSFHHPAQPRSSSFSMPCPVEDRTAGSCHHPPPLKTFSFCNRPIDGPCHICGLGSGLLKTVEVRSAMSIAGCLHLKRTRIVEIINVDAFDGIDICTRISVQMHHRSRRHIPHQTRTWQLVVVTTIPPLQRVRHVVSSDRRRNN